MLTNADAFLAIWHDLDSTGKSEWERWHTYEHMPERVGIPGFLAGRRYMNDDDPEQCCFTMYEGSDLSVFESTAYLERLNNPTPWTRENAPTFRNFTRGACRRVTRAGSQHGYGGVILTVRIFRGPKFSENTKQLSTLNKLTTSICDLEGVTEATIGLCDAEITTTETTERSLRKKTTESTLDGVLIVEGYNVNTIKIRGPNIEELVAMSDVDLTPLPHQIYVLSYMLRG